RMDEAWPSASRSPTISASAMARRDHWAHSRVLPPSRRIAAYEAERRARGAVERSEPPRERPERDGVLPQTVGDPRFLEEQAPLGHGVVRQHPPRCPV